jgi:cellobiose phosphorylase
LEPGYIKGYLPGVRENGGQYTHAAVWVAQAWAQLGDGRRAMEAFDLINPLKHGSGEANRETYKVEPYVVAADVYSLPPHTGRGGWTWYTGSAGWMYRAGVEWLLGFRFRGATLYLDPCIPRAWRRFEIAFRYHSSRYLVIVENPLGVSRGVQVVSVDDAPAVPGETSVALVDDGGSHRVRAILG